MMCSDMRCETGGRSEAGRQSKTRTHTSESGGKKGMSLFSKIEATRKATS